MVTVTHSKGETKRARGIVAAARALGVTRQHLYLVIRGARRSTRIERWLKRNLRKEAA